MYITGVKVDMKGLTMTIHLKGYRRFRVRCFIAVNLFRLAAFILGVRYEVIE